MTLSPIAIVGQACLLPGASTPGALWDAVVSRRDLLTSVPAARWRMDADLAVGTDPAATRDRLSSNRAGCISDFGFSPEDLRLSADMLAGLDPLCHWLLHTGREAIREARRAPDERIGAVVGNLSFPSEGLSRFAESVWLERSGLPPAARPVARENRFMSGLPVHILAGALGLDAGVLALDAACASSLYAMKIACTWLDTGRADLMLAGGVNRADMLFIQMGFTALTALSPTGRSRPFHREADGLVPAEGAGLIALRRLDDAVRRKDTILGVIRGIGLSNDGRSEGMLIPSGDGQVRAMQSAYEVSGINRADIGLIECHAPGTRIGDAIEVESLSRVFRGCAGIGIGSVKSNLGHLITAAGAAGVMKVLGAFRTETLPPTLHAEDPLPNIAGSPLRVLSRPEPWKSSGPRRAGVSGFGFGGNNAHVVIEEWRGDRRSFPSVEIPEAPPELAIVGIGAMVADGSGVSDLARALLDGSSRLRQTADGMLCGSASNVTLPLEGLRFPPRDLEAALPQQTAVLQAALEAVKSLGDLPSERTGVLIGMQADAEVARYGMRWRLETWCREWAKGGDGEADPQWLASALAQVVAPLEPSGVIGTMPNIPANRINRQLNLGGPSYTVSSEELSGIRALEIAAHSLHHRELDVAIVGAVDLCCEDVQMAAMPDIPPGDAAVVLVLKRLDDARRNGDRVYAVLPARDPGYDATLLLSPGEHGVDSPVTLQFGHAHACSGLLHVAVAALACHRRMRPQAPDPAQPWLPSAEGRLAEVRVAAQGGQSGVLLLQADRSGAQFPLPGLAKPTLVIYSGPDRAGVLEALRAGRTGNAGPARLALVCDSREELDSLRASALASLSGGDALPAGAYFHERPIGGELAFVFSGPAGAYHGMGRELLLAAPDLADSLSNLLARQDEAAGWLYRSDSVPTPTDKLWGSSFLTAILAQMTRKAWGLRPTAAIGFCSGETNSLFAMGAWSDMDAFHRDVADASIFTREIGGEYATVQRAWGEAGPIAWASWHVLAKEDTLRELLETEPRVHLAIINAPGSFAISGDAAACDRILSRLGAHRARPLNYDLCVHCPETAAFAEGWRRLHHRPTRPVPGVRFYTHSTLDSYEPTADSAADALLGQFSRTVDFPRLIRKAWDDGVRVFLEHGPAGSCSRWIDQILENKEHIAIPLDVTSRSSWTQAWHALAQLAAAGADVPGLTDWCERTGKEIRERTGLTLSLPAHPPPIRLAPLPKQRMHAIHIGGLGLPKPRGIFPGGAQRMMPPPAVMPEIRMPGNAMAIAAARAAAPVMAGVVAAPQIPDLHKQFLRIIGQMALLHEQYISTSQGAFRSLLALATSPAIQQPASGTMHPIPLAPAIVAPPPAPVGKAPPAEKGLPGPKFSRAQLEWLASHEISAVFGNLFKKQDGFERQVRMPEPPLLLADRVTGIDALPGVAGTGTIWTETDVTEDAWYLHAGHMTPGIMIEAGQADLLLVSWMGIDFFNQGRRVYRLLGCDLTYHNGLAHIGDTCSYDIHIDGHAEQGDVRLFFFHSDCRIEKAVRLSVRNGQAGFFTDEELANSAGVLWDSATAEPGAGHLDPPLVSPIRDRFSAGQVQAFSEGRVFECFGPGYELTQTHSRTPLIPSGRMRMLDQVTHLDPNGGPWGRGYLRAEQILRPDQWFLAGHFKNDPCMPGTLMFDGCLQAMGFYLTAMGHTIAHDGWRFEPVSGETFKLRCRGQATPSSRVVVYEVFVRELIAGPLPTLRADLLCTVDGMKAFHCEGAALNLIPDWPLSSMPALLRSVETGRAAVELDGHRFDEKAMLACAWGRPEQAFGRRFKVFDGVRRTGHLPCPPYNFMSRVTRLDALMGEIRSGSSLTVEYDIPPHAFYFADNPAGTMPFAVLMEVALQPCGWLATFLGITLADDQTLFFRNLDGDSVPTMAILPASGILRTDVTCTSVFASGGITIESFNVDCSIGGAAVYTLKTVFGHFPKASLDTQVGLARTPAEKAWLTEPNDFFMDLRSTPLPGLATGRMLMIDRVDGWWPGAGTAGLGRMRAIKDINPAEWFFKAHFFYDPVQPGSLGVQAMIQTMQAYAIHTGLADGMTRPVFEDAAIGKVAIWKYRGQVRPTNKTVVIEMETRSVEREASAIVVTADTWLWVDGLCIYQGIGVSIRLADAGPEPGPEHTSRTEFVVTAESDPWVLDHCPTYVRERAVLPMMWVLDRVAQAAQAHAPGLLVTAVKNVRLLRWLSPAPNALRLRTQVEDAADGTISVRLEINTGVDGSEKWELAATAGVTLTSQYPPAPPAVPRLSGAIPAANPYPSGTLFHGPAFQLLTHLESTSGGSSSVLRASGTSAPPGLLNPVLLDAALHGIPHDDLSLWDPSVGSGHAAYPHAIESATFHGPTPRFGEVRCEARMMSGTPEPVFLIQIFAGDTVWAELSVREILLPKGRLGSHPGSERVAFLRERRYVPGMTLSRVEGSRTLLSPAEVAASDWLPGTVVSLFGATAAKDIVAKEHVARLTEEHASQVRLEGGTATVPGLPLNVFEVSVVSEGPDWVATTPLPETLGLHDVRSFWEQRLGLGDWVLNDLYMGLASQFVRRLRFTCPEAVRALSGRPAIYLANHQVQVESLLFPILMGAVTGVPLSTVARREHQPGDDEDLRPNQYWLGPLVAHTVSYPGFANWRPIVFFDQAEPSSMLRILEEHRNQSGTAPHSLFVHVQGTRGQSAGDRITQLSASLLDMALELDAPVVPVWFANGLPDQPVDKRLDFPVDYGRQDYIVGQPVWPDELRALPYARRREFVMDAINALAPSGRAAPAAHVSFATEVKRLEQTGLTSVQAVMMATLRKVTAPSEQARLLLGRADGEGIATTPDAKGQWLDKLSRWLGGQPGSTGVQHE